MIQDREMGANYLRRIILTSLLVLQFDYSAGQCSGSVLPLTATTSLQYISSPNFPSSYNNYDDCDWNISSSSDQVVFYLSEDNIEGWYDRLTIYGSQFYYNDLYYSENHNSPFVDVSPDSHLRVTFTSDGSVTYGGFRMYYIGVSSLDSCGQTLTAATSTAQQLTYVYRDFYSSCDYTINAGTTNFVQITVVLARGSVEITDGGSTQYIYTEGSVYVSSSNSIDIRGSNGNDFVITYEDVTTGSNNIVTTPTSVPSTECIGSGNFITATSTEQFMTSRFYPGAYQNNRYCDVLIEAQNTQDSVYFFVNDNMISYGDNLRVYDGPSDYFNSFYALGTYASYTSSGNSLFITFTTNDYGVDRGFNISFYSVTRGDPLSGVSYTATGNYNATSSQQSIYSPNYPSNYDNNLDEYWLITKPNQDDNIVVDFNTLAVEEALGCVYDKVTFYDGYLVTDPVLLEVCGYEETYITDNTGLYILIRFETDSSVTKKGFEIVFYTGTFQDAEDDEGDEEMPAWGWAVIGLIIVVFLAIVITVCICIVYRMSKVKVGVGKEVPPKPKIEKRTTHQLLTEITSKYGAKINEPKKKVFRKKLADYHPQPNTPGPGVNVITVGGGTPHPPPFPPPNVQPNPPLNPPPNPQLNPQPLGESDPVYPPPYLGTGGNGPPGNVMPVITNIPQTVPTAPVNDPAYPGCVPPPFNYITPAEARANGTYPC